MKKKIVSKAYQLLRFEEKIITLYEYTKEHFECVYNSIIFFISGDSLMENEFMKSF